MNTDDQAIAAMDFTERALTMMRHRLAQLELVQGCVGAPDLMRALDVAWAAAQYVRLEVTAASEIEIDPTLHDVSSSF